LLKWWKLIWDTNNSSCVIEIKIKASHRETRVDVRRINTRHSLAIPKQAPVRDSRELGRGSWVRECVRASRERGSVRSKRELSFSSTPYPRPLLSLSQTSYLDAGSRSVTLALVRNDRSGTWSHRFGVKRGRDMIRRSEWSVSSTREEKEARTSREEEGKEGWHYRQSFASALRSVKKRRFRPIIVCRTYFWYWLAAGWRRQWRWR